MCFNKVSAFEKWKTPSPHGGWSLPQGPDVEFDRSAVQRAGDSPQALAMRAAVRDGPGSPE